MADRPRIGITMRLEIETQRFYLGRDYSEALEKAGALPVHIPLIPKHEFISALMDGLDGVLLPGSNTDVDPLLYGEEPHHGLGTVVPIKDETDRLVIAEAEKRPLPLLGICYGLQALNVWRGGTLVQDIRSEIPGSLKHEQGMPATRNSHSIDIEAGTALAALPAAATTVDQRVNSSHHQAISKLGANLRITARARDGVIEAVEDTRGDRFCMAVQWHPELTVGHDQLSKELFELFVEACRKGADRTFASPAA